MADLAQAWATIAARDLRNAREPAERAAAHFDAIGYGLLRARSLVARSRGVEATDRGAFVRSLQDAGALMEEAGAGWRHASVMRLLKSAGSAGRRAALSGKGIKALSAREREVAALTVQRLTAQQIAEVLVLSRRTVESHLASMYAKLEVHSKPALIEALEAAELDGRAP